MKSYENNAFIRTPDPCGPLYGHTISLEMDDGRSHQLTVLNADTLRWDETVTAYAGMLACDGLYFITFDRCPAPRENLTLALDAAVGLVTLVTARQGLNPRRPTLIAVEVLPGAVARPGQPLPVRRHGYTADLVGKAVKWQYQDGFSIIHIYLSERYYRIKLLQKMDDPNSAYEQAMRSYTDRTEPAFYLRLRPGVYLFGFVEDNMDKVTGPEIACASRVQLIDTARMKTVGRGFGAPGSPLDFFVAEGTFVSLPEADFTQNQIYTV